ncbi:MAG: O-antigen ligase family protein [Spirosomataceae bacterium]
MIFSLRSFLYAGFVMVLAVLVAFIITKGQLIGGLALLALPFAFGFLIWVFRQPIVGLYAVIVMSFLSNGLVRYVPAPLGLSIDALLILTLLALFFQRFETKQWLFLSKNPILYVVYAWCAFCLLQLLNPEARSAEAWFYAMRGMALYLILTVILGMELLPTPKHLQHFIHVWLGFSFLIALNGIKQLTLGLDGAENAWLQAGNASTHILHGKLRVFSFYSDAGQFGAAMAHAGLMALILALGKGSLKKRLIYGTVALVCFYGMAISGTRGALFVPLAGIAAYLVLVRNFKVLVIGALLAGCVFGLLKFTYIGQSNYQIQRMRSALDPNDPSLLVRIENQKRLSLYLATRPLGGGIGSAGYWGLRFSPGTFLAQTPTDSWYVKIWAETGIVGLVLHLFMIGFMLLYFFLKIRPMSQSDERQTLMGLYVGIVGIAAASYGNQLLGQMPTGTVVYLSIALLYVNTSVPLKKRI